MHRWMGEDTLIAYTLAVKNALMIFTYADLELGLSNSLKTWSHTYADSELGLSSNLQKMVADRVKLIANLNWLEFVGQHVCSVPPTWSRPTTQYVGLGLHMVVCFDWAHRKARPTHTDGLTPRPTWTKQRGVRSPFLHVLNQLAI